MIKEDFKLTKAIGDGYRFLSKNYIYLLKASLLPLILHVTCSLFVQFQRADCSVFEAYLWQLPAVAAFGWLMFIEIRLLFFFERINIPITHPVLLAERNIAKQASIIIFILFNMFFKFLAMGLLFVGALEAVRSHPLLSFLPMAIIILMFYCVKFGVLHIVAAVSFPLKVFVNRIKSPLFSIQLMSLAFLSIIPVIFIFQILMPIIVPNLFEIGDLSNIGDVDKIKLILITTPMTLVLSLVLNACAGCAVKQMLTINIKKNS